MARIINSEYNVAQTNNIEKLNGDYFLKTIQADSDGNFITPFAPAEYDEIVLTYVAAGNGIGEIETVIYKLSTVTLSTLTLSYDSQSRLTGVAKA